MCYAWGYNGNGQLGVNSLDSYICTPRKIIFESNEQIVSVSCSISATLFLTKSNKSYYAGNISNSNNDYSTYVPTLVTTPDNEMIKQISCGNTFGALVTFSGKCYRWGYCEDNWIIDPTLGNNIYPFFPNKKIVQLPDLVKHVSCGDIFFVCVTESNRCYGLGDFRYSSLESLIDDPQPKNPTLIKYTNVVQTISMGFNIMFITSDNQYYIHNSCSHTYTEKYKLLVPKPIKSFSR